MSIRKYWIRGVPEEERYCIYFQEHYKGYYDLCLQFTNAKFEIFYSTCTNTIDDLVRWIERLDRDDTVISFSINEEGPIIRIILERTHYYDKDLHTLRLIKDWEPYQGYEFKKVISKKGFITRLLYAIKKLMDERGWGTGSIYGNEIIEGFSPFFKKYSINEYGECNSCRQKVCIGES